MKFALLWRLHCLCNNVHDHLIQHTLSHDLFLVPYSPQIANPGEILPHPSADEYRSSTEYQHTCPSSSNQTLLLLPSSQADRGVTQFVFRFAGIGRLGVSEADAEVLVSSISGRFTRSHHLRVPPSDSVRLRCLRFSLVE